MAWVKLDDQAPRHAKMLKAGPAACWLWVCGIAHCQSQLTDGFVSLDALPMIGVKGEARCVKLADELVSVGLFDKAEGGYLVHGYLDHNPSKATVLAKRAEDADRKRRGEESQRTPRGIQTESRRNPELPAPASHPIPSDPYPSVPDRKESARRSAGQPPLNLGLRRFKVWRWMLDDCIAALGEHAEAFDIEAWLQQLDAKETRVIPDVWPWLKNELLAEARRRGLAAVETSDRKPMFTQSVEEMGKAALAIVNRDTGLPR